MTDIQQSGLMAEDGFHPSTKGLAGYTQPLKNFPRFTAPQWARQKKSQQKLM